jgi:hypothetical protein
MSLCIPLKVERRFGGTWWRFHLHGGPVTIFSSETPIDFQRTTRSYIFGDRTLRNNRCENYKSCILLSSILPLLLPLILLAWSKTLELTCRGLPCACWHPSYKKMKTLSSRESELLTCFIGGPLW